MQVKTLDNEPVILPQSKWLWRAFDVLSGSRLYNDAGPQPIQFSEILAYAQFSGCQEWHRDLLVRIIALMDREFLDYHQRKRNKDNRNNKRGQSLGKNKRSLR